MLVEPGPLTLEGEPLPLLATALALELVELDHEVVDVVASGHLVEEAEALEQGLLRDVEDHDPELEVPAHQLDVLPVVLGLVEVVEVAVPEVHDEQVEVLALVVLEQLLELRRLPGLPLLEVLEGEEGLVGESFDGGHFGLDLDGEVDELALRDDVGHRLQIAILELEGEGQFVIPNRHRILTVQLLHLPLELLHDEVGPHLVHAGRDGLLCLRLHALLQLILIQV